MPALSTALYSDQSEAVAQMATACQRLTSLGDLLSLLDVTLGSGCNNLTGLVMAERRTDKIGRAGEHYVAAELNRRGAHASPFSGNVPEIDIVATDDDGKRIAHIQVKTKRSPGNWHMGLKHGWASITLGGCPKDSSCGEECTPKLCDPIVGKRIMVGSLCPCRRTEDRITTSFLMMRCAVLSRRIIRLT